VNALEVRGLAAGYTGVPVVRDVDLVVAPGEVVALLGPNGAGKTTTLLAISGLVRRFAGTVSILGRDVRVGRDGTPARPWRIARAGLAHVPEDRSLFHGLTVAETLRLARRRGHRDALAPVLDLFPALAGLADRRAGLLSGGEQQMLALARALVAEPHVLLVDEMSLGLAPVVVERLLPVVRRIADERDVAVVMVEQHVDLALEIADRGYVLRRGTVELQGTSDDLRAQRDRLEAGYLGGEPSG
jgi:branched-chain amino acid transport system ATP-binding protein